ncbi:MAG: hypothetical protein SFU53_07555 [Terrimicrobiaceae bacterium]|nr:hypothetical protein [Terrimicrobiaceae bacterium]
MKSFLLSLLSVALLAGCQSPRPVNLTVESRTDQRVSTRSFVPVVVKMSDGWTFTARFHPDPATRIPAHAVDAWLREAGLEVSGRVAAAVRNANLPPGEYRAEYALAFDRRREVTFARMRAEPAGSEFGPRIDRALRKMNHRTRWNEPMWDSPAQQILVDTRFDFVVPAPPAP